MLFTVLSRWHACIERTTWSPHADGCARPRACVASISCKSACLLLARQLACPCACARIPRKGTNWVSTNGVTANYMFLGRGTCWVPICRNLSFVCVPFSPIRQNSLLLQRPQLGLTPFVRNQCMYLLFAIIIISSSMYVCMYVTYVCMYVCNVM